MPNTLSEHIAKLDREINGLKTALGDRASEVSKEFGKLEGISKELLTAITTEEDNVKIKEYKEKQLRASDLAISQLSFLNNLLILMGTGVLAFMLEDKNLPKLTLSFSSPEWNATHIGLALLFLVLSIATGFIFSLNRFLAFVHRDNTYSYLIDNIEIARTPRKIPVKKAWRYWFKKPDFYKLNKLNGDKTLIEAAYWKLESIRSRLTGYTIYLLVCQILFFTVAIIVFSIYKIF